MQAHVEGVDAKARRVDDTRRRLGGGRQRQLGAGYKRRVDVGAPELPDYEIFASLPGAGPALAPRLLVAFGERRERSPSAASMQKFAGVAPVTERSGKKCWVYWRWSCSKFLRQTFVEWAGQTIPRSRWAKAFYAKLRAKGTRHQAALRALAFNWIRILYRCWIERVPYDEKRYLEVLEKRGSSLLKLAAEGGSI